MNHIAPLLTLDCVALDEDIPTRKRAFEAIGLIVEKCAGISHQAAFDALIARERLGSTCLGGGIAIPHGRIEDLDQIVLSILRTKEPITWDTPDNRKARLFFGVMIPKNDPDKYLDVLADIAALLKNKEAKEFLLNAETPLEVCQYIGNWQAPKEEPQAAGAEDYPEEESSSADSEKSDQ